MPRQLPKNPIVNLSDEDAILGLVRYMSALFNGDVPVEKHGTCFVLMLCPMGSGKDRKIQTYSNAETLSLINILREQANRYEEEMGTSTELTKQ